MYLLLLLLLAPADTGNPLEQSLREQGVAIPGLGKVKLPASMMTEGLTSKEEKAILAKAAGKMPLDLFLRKSDTAPFVVEINSLEDAKGNRQAQTIDLRFVAQGKLDTVARTDVLNQLLGIDPRSSGSGVERAEVLTPAQLSERGIKLLSKPGTEERYSSFNATFLDKVQVSGITHNVKTTSPRSVVAAMELDPRFEKDPQFPNRWRSIDRRPDAREPLGPPQPYTGFAGYARVTELSDGLLFVELHTVFHEPHGWFEGRNLLRSKLPLVLQENVRKFRRTLSSASTR